MSASKRIKLEHNYSKNLYEVKNDVNNDLMVQRTIKEETENFVSDAMQERDKNYRRPLTDSEKCKRYRLRQKMKNLNNELIDDTVTNACYLRPRRTRLVEAVPDEHISYPDNIPPTNILYIGAYNEFQKQFIENIFGFACTVCDRLWFKNDLKPAKQQHEQILRTIIHNFDHIGNVKLCSTCTSSLNKNKIPTLAVYNGFKYPDIPSHLPELDIVTERLISPRIPFMQIKRLRHVHGQHSIYGQIINVPVTVNTMVNSLPRNVSEDHNIFVHIKRKKIHRSSFVKGLVNKRTVRVWLEYLVNTPLYMAYNVNIDESFFNNDTNCDNPIDINELSEDINIENSLVALQQTLLWDDDHFLRIAPGEQNLPISLLFDEHAEELSFPAIYLGQFRTFREGVSVSTFQMATSELRRSDRRGVTPQHLLYLCMKNVRERVRNSLTVAFKFIGRNTRITRREIQSEEYINNCLEHNLAFLKSIPNSAWYWSQRKRDLFAIIRQLGKPTAFLTLSANEIGWPNLMKLLYKFKNNGAEMSDEDLANMHFIEKSSYINNDAVTCAIYFHKLVCVILNILSSKRNSPFGQYRVVNYFKRIEFQHRGSPHAHILLWLENAPSDALGQNYSQAIDLINNLISVSPDKASGYINLQKHKHTFTCYKNNRGNNNINNHICRFNAPFMPSKSTIILTPMQKSDPNFNTYYNRFKNIKLQYENNDYTDIEEFYTRNNILSDEDYYNLLRSSIKRPTVFLKRKPLEKWNNAFNPFILSILKSNMDLQFIIEEYSCAAYVVEYVNKANRGISDLHRQIIEVMNEHPEFDVTEITRQLSVNVLNSIEISSQEAAWFLLREPMSKASIAIVYIPTIWPIERERLRKSQRELENLDDESTDIWKENLFDKYQARPNDLNDVSLAQFSSKYYKNNRNQFVLRTVPRVIRYRNYDMAVDLNDYKREMVTLHIPFRNEEEEILAEMKFIEIYNANESLILQKRKEFESNIDIQKTLEICRLLCRENDNIINEQLDESHNNNVNRISEENPFDQILNPNSEINADLRLATLNKIGSIAKKKQNLMDNAEFCRLMKSANLAQKNLLLHIISHLLTPISEARPLQLFFTGAAGCGKTFVIKLIMEIYNKYSDTDGFCNAYITCASTGKAAVAIDGTTVHTALKITLSRLMPLSTEVIYQYRALFKYIKVLIIDEVSMIGAELLLQIDLRLKQITGNSSTNFGGLDIILIGDLRQLPPVRATPIYKQPKQRMPGPALWRDLKFYELTQVMRQSNVEFSSILTKIGTGDVLHSNEIALIESRFFSIEDVQIRSPHGTRLYLKNNDVTAFNNSVLQNAEGRISCIAEDILSGVQNAEQEAILRQKLHKMSTIDTGGLPFETVFVLNKSYIITTNIDVSDGLANGALGKLVFIEYNTQNDLIRVWLEFSGSPKIGQLLRRKAAAHAINHQISRLAVPISRRTVAIHLNNNRTIFAKRKQFPLVAACAMTIHKSQGGTFSEIIYDYDKSHCQQLVYVALSRVTSIDGLFITNSKNIHTFYHGRNRSASMLPLQQELQKLSSNRIDTIPEKIINFISEPDTYLSIFYVNCQGLPSHFEDLNDVVSNKCNLLLLSETNIDSNTDISIQNFTCIGKYKRPHTRCGGVAVYQNTDITNTNNSNILFKTVTNTHTTTSAVGDIFISHFSTRLQEELIIIVLYITPDTPVNKIIHFLHFNLLPFTDSGSQLLNSNYNRLPMILCGDFNVNFDHHSALPLLNFLDETLNLKIVNNPKQTTTKSGTAIDAIFSRHLSNVESKMYVSYYSYHNPIICTLKEMLS